MPAALVALDGARVLEVMPLEHVQRIEVMHRADAPHLPGVVRFRYGERVTAYTLPDHVAFGLALTEAAKRSLEDPPQFYGKKSGKGMDDQFDEDDI